MKRVLVSARVLVVLAATIVFATWKLTSAHEEVVADQAQTMAALPTPALHHVGLNVVDPATSQQFYKTIWPQGQTVAGMPAYKSDMYLLFTKVSKPASGKWDMKERRSLQQSPLWHIGFETQTTTIKERLKRANAMLVPPGAPQEGGYAYFLGPDQKLIEAGDGPGQEGRRRLPISSTGHPRT
jgi:catechol 2,3-dioxygenase-like lactoylglutathione lyase family enzyme